MMRANVKIMVMHRADGVSVEIANTLCPTQASKPPSALPNSSAAAGCRYVGSPNGPGTGR
jgi:hypothetical protein